MCQDLFLKPLVIHRSIQGTLLSEEPFTWAVFHGEGIPVIQYQVPEGFRKRDVAILMVLRLNHMNLMGRMNDVLTLEMAEFIKPQAGGIKHGDGQPHLVVFQ